MVEGAGGTRDGDARPDASRRRVLAIARPLLFGCVLLVSGGAVSGLLLVINLETAPALPWFLPATGLWLSLFWRHARGDGWPRSTSDWRSEQLRAKRLSARAWGLAMLAGGLAVTAVMGIAFMTYRFAALPEAAYQAPFAVAGFPPWTLVSIFAVLALSAAVVEESAFRGFMLSGFQGAFGWRVGIGIVTILFYIAHLSHAYATIAFLPFFLAHGLVFGLLVRITRSIVPGIVLHAVSDFVVLPMQYGVIPSAGQWAFVAQGWMSLLCAVAAVPAFRSLARTMALERGDPTRK